MWNTSTPTQEQNLSASEVYALLRQTEALHQELHKTRALLEQSISVNKTVMEQLVPYWALFCRTKLFIEEFMVNQEASNEPAFVQPNWPCEQLPQCLLDAENYLQDIEYEVGKEAQGAAGEGDDVLTRTVVHYLEKVQNFLDQNVDNAEEMEIINQASLL